MKNETKWLNDLGRQADREFYLVNAAASEASIINNISIRLEKRSALQMTFCTVLALLFCSFSAWYFCKLDYEMSHSSWPAYTQYQQFQNGEVR